MSLWRTEGVPMPLMRRVSELTAGVVSVEAMLAHALDRKTAKRATVEG